MQAVLYRLPTPESPGRDVPGPGEKPVWASTGVVRAAIRVVRSTRCH